MPDEGFVLDGLNLNGAGLVVESGDFTPPAKRLEWSEGADADGALLVRDPLVSNRVIKLTMRVLPSATMQAAAARILEISKKLEECEQNPGGLPLVWTPADGTVAALTFFVLTGSVTELPISQTGDSGYFVKAPMLTVELTCKPFGYGAEVVGTAVSSTSPVLTLTVASVPGDVPAEGRLIVTDPAATAQQRRTVEWGLEQRYFNAATSLSIDSAALVTAGYGGSQNGSVVTVTAGTTATAVCATADQSHVGTFRVKARVYAFGSAVAGSSVSARLTWRDGDGHLSSNAYAKVPFINAFAEIDLGIVSIAPTVSGTQKWMGRIDAVATASGVRLDIDYLVLVPAAEGYGRVRGPVLSQTGLVVANDTFAAGTNGSALNGRVAEAGGTWASAGSVTDFLYNSAGFIQRSSTAADTARHATIGALSNAAQEVTADFGGYPTGSAPFLFEVGLLCRYVDASNYAGLRVTVERKSDGSLSDTVQIVQVVAGVTTVLAAAFVPSSTRIIKGRVTAVDGTISASWGSTVISASSTALAAGGALATGKFGLHDRVLSGTPHVRDFDTFLATQIPSSPPAIYASRSVEFRSDGNVYRTSSDGSSVGQASPYRGSRFMVPPAGDKNRTTRIAVTAARNDLDQSSFDPVGDNLTVQVRLTPRYLVVGA